MVAIYVRKIRENEMTIEEVSAYWKEKVQEKLSKEG